MSLSLSLSLSLSYYDIYIYIYIYIVQYFAKSYKYYLSLYEVLAALCLLPQLWMFHLDKRVPSVLANFILFFALHKAFVLVFWIAYPFVDGESPPNRSIQIAFDSMSLLILADFLYYWARSKLKGYEDVVLDEEIALVEFNSSIDE